MLFKKPQPPVNPNKDAIAKHVRAADIFAKEGKFDEAMYEIDRALQYDPKNYYAISFKERIKQYVEKQKQRHQTTQDGTDQRVEKISNLLKNAEQYIQYKQYKFALDEVKKVYAIDPTNYYAQAFSDRIDQLMTQEKGQPVKAAPVPPRPAPTRQTAPASQEGRIDVYRQMLKEVWFDGAVNALEAEQLKKARGIFRISENEHREMEKQVHIDAYVEALRIAWRDGAISNNEDQVLQIMRRKFNISTEEHLAAESKILWAKSSPHAKGTILIVDDEKSIVHLKKHGYDAVTAESPEKALELIEQNPPALILSDLNFQTGMTGMDFYEKVRHNEAFRAIPFILMSGINDNFVIRAALRMGIDSFLGKPFNLELLLATVEGKIQSPAS
ncbi:MAG: hypothetical protein HW374_1372 [Bacteroidetes bacterium]|nr:hypothetical protein [Bacteroidota bacterium]